MRSRRAILTTMIRLVQIFAGITISLVVVVNTSSQKFCRCSLLPDGPEKLKPVALSSNSRCLLLVIPFILKSIP